ncbi:ThyX-like thymidylate synthase [Stenotrophomonas phage Piffle]|uniref:ThyX-like thymidylate synthase n=1 Tax=Stenotrophomonas phage Piffle TaxID=2859656 RepID=A0AAE8BLF5_9CAUD|nr:thymidylate synthase [Stenotrophomonas phage Piffle]QYW01903.1 ThyX-like thymidylate synthase [Stenotrophomonas phage Piffle]
MKSVDAPIILAHSISPEGIELITWQLRYWRPIHSELMTHRVFSRNAGSSRARPSQAIIDQVMRDPWGPLHWGANQAGMQAETELTDAKKDLAERRWRTAATEAAFQAQDMNRIGAHKQIVNRLLEPFTYIDVVLSGTDFANWYALRDHKDAQPEIRELASLMKEVQAHSEPKLLEPGEWHLPYIGEEDWEAAENHLIGANYPTATDTLELLKKASAARCARVSYKLFDGSKANFEADLELFNRLLVSQPLHASPAEHQATPDEYEWNTGYQHTSEHGNFRGWRQFRKTLPNEFVPG